MSRVLVNTIYGGFSLSREAFLLLRKEGYDMAWKEPDYGECYENDERPRIRWYANEAGHFLDDVPRDDPIILSLVEKLGCEKASGSHCKLDIQTVPPEWEGCWKLSTHDGKECLRHDIAKHGAKKLESISNEINDDALKEEILKIICLLRESK